MISEDGKGDVCLFRGWNSERTLKEQNRNV
uniref:Uncharacterized protein n=1 Tax=Candidatus Kentrum sp. MB TaxID=2138164 RepID=A0A450X9B5_9GAMM|nr:MAG: hypothetical protein BECKMB1821G_GA0114241_101640 [Candidatus Kentron sp. MB]VFK27230.1 MAG: hypothetical protein BECKMB1821I_GA0114274_100291 [Candidatus Kentron sp. MB]VFK75103.1 MAG: hypothetical protein BECKMB1821H_GA0114242_101540 [Candidatus Kentron sp. MB]